MKSKLAKELNDLQKELRVIDTLDKNSVEQLKALRADIDKVIDESTATSEHEHGNLKTSLSLFVKNFEETHPKLISTANRAIRILGQMGISG